MAGIRGVRNPKPKKGGAPTGIFSTGGSQKKDALRGSQKSNASMTASEYRGPKVNPKRRDNKIRS